MKKIIVGAIIFALVVLSCSLDPVGDGLGKNSTGQDDYASCKPAAVSGVWTVNKSSSGITLAWNRSKGAKYYNIYRDGELIKTTTDTSFEDDELIREKTYAYNIASVNDCGENAEPFFHVECTKPTAPTGVGVKMKTGGVVEISWDDNYYRYSSYSFNIYRSNEENGKYSPVATVEKTSTFTDTISDAASLFYKVTKAADCDESDMSKVASCMSLSKPSGVTAKAVSATRVEISWNKIYGATGYDIYRAENKGGTYLKTINISDTSYAYNNLSPITTCYYFVTAKNNCRETGSSDTVSVKTLLRAPTEITAEAVSVSNIKVSWKSNGEKEAVGYNIYRSLKPTQDFELVANSITDTLFNDENLLPSTHYYYKAAAVEESGREGELSGNVSVVTKNCTEKPDVPQNLSAEAATPTSIKISWDEAYKASSYEIYASTSETGKYSRVAVIQRTLTLPSYSYADTLLTPSKTYYYKIIAINDCGKSDTSNAVSATTQDCIIPPAPEGISAKTLSSREIKISWDKVENASRYSVYRATNKTSTYSLVARIPEIEFTDSVGLLPVKTYYYKIASAIDCGESEKSDYDSATTESCPPPNAPTVFSISALSSSSIRIAWNMTPEASGYEIYRAASDTETYELVGNANNNPSSLGRISYDDSGLSPSTEYYYKVRAVSDCGKSDFYETSKTTEPCREIVAPRPWARSEAPAVIRVYWDRVYGAKSYNIYRVDITEKDPVKALTLIGRMVSSNYTIENFRVANLSSLTAYYFKVSAINECEEELISATISATTESH